MPHHHLIDTFPAFLALWENTRYWSPEAQFNDWATIYMDPWPELLNKQVDDYASMDMDWHEVALEHVFPYLDQRIPDMKTAHGRLPTVCKEVYARAREHIGLDCDVVSLLYVGTGCGAGWVRYDRSLAPGMTCRATNRPAISWGTNWSRR